MQINLRYSLTNGAILFSCTLIFSACTTDAPVEFAASLDSTPIEVQEERDSIEVINGTFLGNDQRNYYGDSIGNELTELWKLNLGSGVTNLADGQVKWSGAGWTGQPLMVREHDKKYLLLGCYDHNLKKIDAQSGELVWSYKYDDVIKGTGSIWVNKKAETPEEKFVILQGSRLGIQNSLFAENVYSYRGVSYMSGQELWRMNSKKGKSYSRDVDASAITIGDTAYIGLENGSFISFGPGKQHLSPIASTGFYEPSIFQELPLYNDEDARRHGGNLVTEASPARIGNHLYIASGSGHVFGYNLDTKEIDWTFDIGADLDGSPVVTSDGCILVTVEKQYIKGHGGVFKLNPSKKPDQSVVWYFPTGDKEFADWHGGVIGSVAINDSYNENGDYTSMAVFTGIDGTMYLVDHKNTDPTETCFGPNKEKEYPMPLLLDQKSIGPSISTPIFVGNKIVAAGYQGVNLFTVNKAGEIVGAIMKAGVFEASPIADRGKIYIASRNGYLYCFGSENETVDEPQVETSPKKEIKPKPKPEVPRPKPRKETKPTNTAPSQAGNLKRNQFYLVAGAYGVRSNAVNEEKRFKAQGIDVFIAKGPDNMNYVIVGQASSQSGINSKKSQLLNEFGVDAWVYRGR